MRKCSICHKQMNEGFCHNGGETYYCSEPCLHHDFTEEEWDAAYNSGNESYWTQWDD